MSEENQSGIDAVNAMPEPLVERSSESLESSAEPTKEEIKQMLKEYEIKVNGKAKKVKFDPSDDKAIIKALQMQEAGQLAMQERAELESLINKTLLQGKQNPKQFLQQHLGLDPQQLLESWLEEEIEQRKKSPEQLEKERIQKELEDYRMKLKAVEEEKENERKSRLEQQAASDLDKEILNALSEDKELPKSRKTVRRIVDAMLWAMDPEGGNYPQVQVKDILPAVKAEIRNEMNEFISELPEEAFETYLGKNNLERMRKKRLAAMKAAPASTEVKPIAKNQATESKKEEKISSKDFFRKLGRS